MRANTYAELFFLLSLNCQTHEHTFNIKILKPLGLPNEYVSSMKIVQQKPPKKSLLCKEQTD